MKTINDVAKELCTGCGACANECSAIEMKTGYEGFKYPQIQTSKCIDCGLCYKTCPAVNPTEIPPFEPMYYAVMADDELRLKSSSGGVMTLLAEKILEQGGYICGAAWEKDFEVEHIIVDNSEGLDRIRKSKYVQSDMNDVYKQIQSLLKNQKPVMFTGCPCQVAGMRHFFGNKFSNLFLVDIICHGVPSPLAWEKYLEEKRKIGQIKNVDFRNKNKGWGSHMFLTFENGYTFYDDCYHDPYYRGFLGGVTTRPSCSTCKYANINRVGDVTIGDFWGVSSIDKGLNDDKGTGLVIINTKSGEKMFSSIFANIKKMQKISCEKVVEIARTRNGRLLTPSKMNPSHYRFFELIRKKDFSEAFDYAVNWKYDIGILGWWANLNYGGTLTYFALYTALKNMGYEVMMIEAPRDNRKQPEQNTVPRRFARKHYKISQVYSHAAMPVLNDHCKAFISGSDQLWNPVLKLWSDPVYFLSFANDNRIKLSYASSFGNSTSASKEFVEQYAPLMKRFQGISVREDYAVDVCKNVFGVEAVHVCDPVFLCNREVYEKLIPEATEKYPEKFILNFLLDPNEEKNQLIDNVSSKLGLSCVNFTDLQFVDDKIKAFGRYQVYANSDIENLIKAYKEADFVITDSFHGTCFAVIFNKPFISIANEGRGVMRFESLLRWLRLEKRLVYDINNVASSEEFFEPIDYEPVNDLINATREKSLSWLKNKLSDIK